MGRYQQALGFLEKAYQKDPFEPDIMEHLADYYRLKKDTGKVIEIYRRAIDNDVDFKHRLMEKMKKLITGQPQKSPKDTK
jgi:tetratricopeptide (TPR) repeat protein